MNALNMSPKSAKDKDCLTLRELGVVDEAMALGAVSIHRAASNAQVAALLGCPALLLLRDGAVAVQWLRHAQVGPSSTPLTLARALRHSRNALHFTPASAPDLLAPALLVFMRALCVSL